MKIYLLVFFALVLGSVSVYSQPPSPAPTLDPNKKSVLDIKKQIDATPQKKFVQVVYDSKANKSMVATTRLVLGHQDLTPDDGAPNNSPGFLSATIPTWELSVYTMFESPYITQTAVDYIWKINVYRPLFPLDSELRVIIDKNEMTFKAEKSGRSLTSDLALSGGDFQKDKTSDDVRNNAGNISRAAKPTYFFFRITRADMEKVCAAPKVKIALSKQMDVNLQKDYKDAISMVCTVTTAP